jgi:hypothetical protein
LCNSGKLLPTNNYSDVIGEVFLRWEGIAMLRKKKKKERSARIDRDEAASSIVNNFVLRTNACFIYFCELFMCVFVVVLASFDD